MLTITLRVASISADESLLRVKLKPTEIHYDSNWPNVTALMGLPRKEVDVTFALPYKESSFMRIGKEFTLRLEEK